MKSVKPAVIYTSRRTQVQTLVLWRARQNDFFNDIDRDLNSRLVQYFISLHNVSAAMRMMSQLVDSELDNIL